MAGKGLMKIIAVLLLTCSLAWSSAVHSADLDAGVEAYFAEDYNKAMQILGPLSEMKAASPQGDPIAQYFVGEMFYYGQSVEQDYTKAMHYYKLSAAQGDFDAQYSIGYMYDEGLGVDPNIEEAKDWYELAAKQGQTSAQVGLANLFLDNQHGHDDVTNALVWLRTAAELNDVNAQHQLGVIYEEGEIVPVDLNEAIQWYQYAVAQGDTASLEAINGIKGREDFIESYPRMLRRLGLTAPDADALLCENFTWASSVVLKVVAEEEGDEVLDKFADKALKRVSEFRDSLDSSLDLDSYGKSPAFREIVRNLEDVARSERNAIQEKIDSAGGFTAEDLIFFSREQAGVFTLVYDDAFWSYYESLSADEDDALWDYCVTKYMPSGWTRSDIGLKKLQAALRKESAVQQVYYSTLDYGKGVIDWSKTKYQQVKHLDVCEGDFDFLGGAAVGTATTAVLAGESVLMIVTSSGLFIAAAPAIATGVTATAIAGATVYAGARGYCYLFKDDTE